MNARSRQSTFNLLLTFAALISVQSLAAGLPQRFKLNASDGAVNDWFGKDVAVGGGYVLVGAYGNDDFGSVSGAAYVFDLETGEQLHKLLPSVGGPTHFFGCDVAISQTLAVVGAHGYKDGAYDGGAVFVFDMVTGQELRKLLASNPTNVYQLGKSVAADGNYLISGGPIGGPLGGGSAFVFDLTTGNQLFELVPADNVLNDAFGHNVAVQGNNAVIGAPDDFYNGMKPGSAYIFDITTSQELVKLIPSDGSTGDRFGSGVAIHGDRVYVGAPKYSLGGTEIGTAYVFDRVTGQQLDQLSAPDGGGYDNFGGRISAGSDYFVISAWQKDYGSIYWAGTAYLFDTSTGLQTHKLLPFDLGASDKFAVDVGVDGDRIVCGAYHDDDLGQDSGSAYVFDFSEPGHGYCFGDVGSGTPCPCSNDNDGSVPGSGCANSVFASGAQLRADGFASVTADNVVLVSTGLEPNNNGLYFQANNAIWGGDGFPFGDGLRCAGGSLIRLQLRPSDGAGVSSTTIPLAVKGGIAAGDRVRYQCWYRTNVNPICGPVYFFNMTNGYEIIWAP